MLALRDLILEHHPDISEGIKYGSPFFLFRNKNLCYIWFDKKTSQPYIGFIKGSLIDHPALEAGDRKVIKVLRINPEEDLPFKQIREILDLSILYF